MQFMHVPSFLRNLMMTTMQSAIPILVGTKFDDFVQLPPDIQWTIVTQVPHVESSFLLYYIEVA